MPKIDYQNYMDLPGFEASMRSASAQDETRKGERRNAREEKKNRRQRRQEKEDFLFSK